MKFGAAEVELALELDEMMGLVVLGFLLRFPGPGIVGGVWARVVREESKRNNN